MQYIAYYVLVGILSYVPYFIACLNLLFISIPVRFMSQVSILCCSFVTQKFALIFVLIFLIKN